MNIKIPTNGKITIPNNSDLFGNIWFTKNINLDEEGYMKLSSRVVSLASERDISNLRLPLAFGRKSVFSLPSRSTDFAMVQSAIKGYWVTITETGTTFNPDVGTGAPTFTEDSHGIWYKNLWHVTNDTDLFYKEGIEDVQTYVEITDGTPANLTSGKVHFLEQFRSKNAICVTNGNTVNLYTEDGSHNYSLDVTVTLPADYEAVALSYSNTKMGIICLLSDTVSGQNQDAFFFVWDGATTASAPGVPIGSDKAIAICAYKGSWVILTRTGQFKFYTGGGWQDIGALPLYYQKVLWGQSFNRDLLGDVMLVEGDLIYINVNALFNATGQKYQQYSQNNPGGILCYDPKVGIYHRYSPSISPVSLIKVAQADVNTTTDIMTITALTAPFIRSSIPSTGSQVKYVSDRTNQIGGLTTPKVYYCIKHNATTFSLALTKADALAGNKIDLTSTGASNNYFLGLETYDYGATYTNKSGAMALMGQDTPMYDHLIFGAELNNYDDTGNYNHVNLTAPDFENRGYIVTAQINSPEILSKTEKLHVLYRPLKTNDKIIAKFKDKDILGLPVSTPQGRTAGVNQCNWTSTTTLTTTADLSDAKTAFDALSPERELECEIIAGAGAGVLVKISNITESGGTYTVTLADAVDGTANGYKCDIIIDNWTVLGEITSTDTDGYKTFNPESSSTGIKYKVELRGTEVTAKVFVSASEVDKPI